MAGQGMNTPVFALLLLALWSLALLIFVAKLRTFAVLRGRLWPGGVSGYFWLSFAGSPPWALALASLAA
jgi:hypothetical protein